MRTLRPSAAAALRFAPRPAARSTRRTGARRTVILAALALATALPLAFPSLAAQDPSTDPSQGRGAPRASEALDLTYRGYGVSFGNSPELRGLRLNLRDAHVRRIDGINITLWKAGANSDARVRALSLGLVGPEAGRLEGISLGGVFVASSERTAGISAALANLTEGRLVGVNLGGVVAYAAGGATGVNLGGLGLLGDGPLIGLNTAAGVIGAEVAGLSAGAVVISDSAMTGFNAGLLAAYAGADARWVNLAALATVVRGNATGLSLGGLALWTGGAIDGGAASTLLIRAGDDVRWLALTPGVLTSRGTVTGLGVGGLYLRAADTRGLVVSTLNRIDGRQRGISIGLVNDAAELRGIQVGLLNRVRSRSGILRVLPLIQVGK